MLLIKEFYQVFRIIKINLAERLGNFYFFKHLKDEASVFFKQALASVNPEEWEYKASLIQKIQCCERKDTI